MAVDRNFYEDDEPLEKLLAAFDAGEQGVTAPPPRGVTEFVHFESAGPSGVEPQLSFGNGKRRA